MPDGTVLSLLTDDRVPPAEVVHRLTPSLREKVCHFVFYSCSLLIDCLQGLYIGRWQVEGSNVVIEDLRDSEGILTRYTFDMLLHLQSRPMGR